MNKNGIVHLWDLPYDEICIKLNHDLQKEIVRLAVNICGNKHKLSVATGVDRITLIDFEKSKFQSISMKVLVELCEFLKNNGFNEYSLEEIEKHIELISHES